MPEFIADTDGEVLGQAWDDLRPFVQGYIECMLFTETCSEISMVEWEEPENQKAVEEGEVDGSIPTDSGYGDIHPDSMMRIHLDCDKFLDKARHLLSQAYGMPESTRNGPVPYDAKRAGNDFWYDRNGHGTGFEDRDLGELGDKLTAIAQPFGQVCTDFIADPESPTGYGFVYLS